MFEILEKLGLKSPSASSAEVFDGAAEVLSATVKRQSVLEIAEGSLIRLVSYDTDPVRVVEAKPEVVPAPVADQSTQTNVTSLDDYRASRTAEAQAKEKSENDAIQSLYAIYDQSPSDIRAEFEALDREAAKEAA